MKIIVAFTPGTGIDILAREVGQVMAQRLGQPFLVENRPGASGNIGMGLVAKAEPDGYTISVMVNTFAMNAALFTNPAKTPREVIDKLNAELREIEGHQGRRHQGAVER